MENKRARTIIRKGAVRDAVLKRDNYTCKVCKQMFCEKDNRHYLHVHHIVPVSILTNEQLMDTNLCETLCYSCHKDVHYSKGEYTYKLLDGIALAFKTLYPKVYEERKSWFSRSIHRLPFLLKTGDGSVLEGSEVGDVYDEYPVVDRGAFVDCACYYHEFGGWRELNICTHVGAFLVDCAYREKNLDALITRLELEDARFEAIRKRKEEFTRVAIELSKKIHAPKQMYARAVAFAEIVQVEDGDSWTMGKFAVRIRSDGHYQCGEIISNDEICSSECYFPCEHVLAVMIYRKSNIGARKHICEQLKWTDEECVKHVLQPNMSGE